MAISKLPTSASLKEVMDKFEEISLLDLSLIDVITATELPKTVKNGQIINYDDETSLVSYKTNPESYWTLDQVTNFKNKISIYLGEEDYDN